MKILHTVESYIPSQGGMVEVVRQISERLVKRGHQITIATSINPQRHFTELNGVLIKDFNITGNSVDGIRDKGEDWANYIELLLEGDFDIITNFAMQTWSTDLALPILQDIKAKKVSVPTGFSGLYLPEYQNYFNNLTRWMPHYDMNVFHSTTYRDFIWARKNDIRNIVIIPNGASAEEFLPESTIDIRSQLSIPKEEFLIILVGVHDGQKGHAEAIKIFQQAKIKATLVIIGSRISPKCYWECKAKEFLFPLGNTGKRLIVTELSRERTIALYKTANLFLFPSNIECSPLVLFEAMAAKTPFLVTDVGNAREIVRWSHAGIVLPTIKDEFGFSHAVIKESADILTQFVNQPKWLENMAERGFHAWQNRFTWEKITDQYERMYRSLL